MVNLNCFVDSIYAHLNCIRLHKIETFHYDLFLSISQSLIYTAVSDVRVSENADIDMIKFH